MYSAERLISFRSAHLCPRERNEIAASRLIALPHWTAFHPRAPSVPALTYQRHSRNRTESKVRKLLIGRASKLKSENYLGDDEGMQARFHVLHPVFVDGW